MAGSPLVGSRTAVHNMIAASGGKIIRSAPRSAEKERWEVTVAGQTEGDAATGWVSVGVPLDCSGTGRGEARAPRALRDAGLAQRTGTRDAGDVVVMGHRADTEEGGPRETDLVDERI